MFMVILRNISHACGLLEWCDDRDAITESSSYNDFVFLTIGNKKARCLRISNVGERALGVVVYWYYQLLCRKLTIFL